jgi:hypothetical protein
MPVDVLLVENNRGDVVFIRHAVMEFSRDVRITVAKDAKTAVARLLDPGFTPRLGIPDIHLPKGVGPELFKRSAAKGAAVVAFFSWSKKNRS